MCAVTSEQGQLQSCVWANRLQTVMFRWLQVVILVLSYYQLVFPNVVLASYIPQFNSSKVRRFL